jgi:hypothetical protein
MFFCPDSMAKTGATLTLPTITTRLVGLVMDTQKKQQLHLSHQEMLDLIRHVH